MSSATRRSRQTRLRWGIVVGGVAAVVLSWVALGPRPEAVSERLEQRYGVAHVEWGPNARFVPEKLVVDGRDLSDVCTVTGAWGSLDDVEIVCTRDVGIGRVETP